MRNILLSFFILLIHFNVTAQNGLNFQGVARNPSGVILASQKITLKFYILSDLNNGTVEFAETRLVNTNAQGIFSIIIGDTGAINTVGSFSNIAWKLGNKFLKVEMDPNGGSAFVDMGTTQLQNVPFAYYAKGVNAANIDGILPITAGGSGVTNLSQLKTSLNLDKVNNIEDVNKPISSATQAALDTKIESATFSNSLNLKENLTNKATNADLGGVASSDLLYPSQKAVKAYVDAQIASGGVADGGITNVKIANNAAIPFSKLNITKSDITNLGIPSTTDLTSYDAGTGLALNGTTFSVASNVLTTNYQGSATINGSSFNVTNLLNAGSAIIAGTITTTNINANSYYGNGSNLTNIKASALDDNIVTNSNLANFSITSEKIVDASITSSKIGNAAITDSKLFGPVSVSKGGTGTSTLTTNAVLVGNGTNTVQFVNPGSSGNVLKSDGTKWISGSVSSSPTFNTDLTIQGSTFGLGSGNKISNAAIGFDALKNNTSGGANIAIGYNALQKNTSGYDNTAVGYLALNNTTTGYDNTALGIGALGNVTTGRNNVAIGYLANVGTFSDGTVRNAIAIGSEAVAYTSNSITLGNTSITTVSTEGQLTTGDVTYPNRDGTNGQVLSTNGTGTVNWSNISTSGTVEIGGGNYGITKIDAGGTFTADWTNSRLTYMRVGNMVFFTAKIGKFGASVNHQFEIEFKPPIASSFANIFDAMGTITASYGTTAVAVSGSVAANPVYNNTTLSHNLNLRFVLANAGTLNSTPDLYISVSGSYIVR